MSYELYRASVGIDNAAMIAALHEKFPCYGKATQSMINNPEKYAACLTPEAEAHLVSTFGPGPGLVSVKDRPQPKRRPRRAKPNRLVVYLPDELYEKVRQLMTACGFATVQEFLETSLTGIVEEANKREMV